MQINGYISTCNTYEPDYERYLNPSDIIILSGYQIEVFANGLNTPVSLIITEENTMLVAESGLITENPRILKLVNNNFEVFSEGFLSPIMGVNYLNGITYVSHRGMITRISRDGIKQNIITGLPSHGDHYNGKVEFSPDGRQLYFGQGTVTNSGVVGLDNDWLINHPILCDYPGSYIMLNGQNYETRNIMNEYVQGEIDLTGAFSPYGNPNAPNETRKGFLKASGSILRANLDGTMLEQYAWGLRNPINLKFGRNGQLYVANIGYDNRGSRPIANAPDEFFAVSSGVWYGWPDYSGGDPVSLQRFTPEGGATPGLLIKNLPNIPPEPFTTFPTNTNIMGFDFDYYNFGPFGDVYIAEFGSIEFQDSQERVPYAGAGHKVSKIDMKTRTISTFAINKSGFPAYITQEGGFGRPIDVKFGADGAMYILDMGTENIDRPGTILPYTGVIWRVIRI